MVDAIVRRGAGDKLGDDLVDPLVSEIAVLQARGRNELDASSTPKQPIRYECVYRAGARAGQLALAGDSLHGQLIRGKIIGIQVVIEGTEALSRLTLEQSSEFGAV